MILAGLSIYNHENTAALGKMQNIDAVMVGDMFCNKRMCGGTFQLLSRIEELHQAGKKIFFQTPMYVTERNIHELTEMLSYLFSQSMLDGIIVQDLGMLYHLNGKQIVHPIIWNCMGIGRSRVSNRLYYETIMKQGADYIQTNDIIVAQKLHEAGFMVMINFGTLTYTTVNRECYYMFQHNIYDKNCGRKCLSCHEYLTQSELGLQLSIDGYLLNRKLIYENTDQIYQLFHQEHVPVCVYADDVNGLITHVNEIMRGGTHVSE